MKCILLSLVLLGGCASKNWRVVQCIKEEPTRCSTGIWPHTESWCKEYIERKNREYRYTTLKCKEVPYNGIM